MPVPEEERNRNAPELHLQIAANGGFLSRSHVHRTPVVRVQTRETEPYEKSMVLLTFVVAHQTSIFLFRVHFVEASPGMLLCRDTHQVRCIAGRAQMPWFLFFSEKD
jgi:hypothetical protein